MKKLWLSFFLPLFAFGLWYREMGLVTYNNQLCYEYRAAANKNTIKWYLTVEVPNQVLYIKVTDDQGSISRLENIDIVK
ncbi:hypothetical protein ACFL5G_05550 [Candidatus Margulisiibacteriota bacterium]